MAETPETLTPARTIDFEAVFNFRDVGGYEVAGGGTVRWRILFRADGLNRLTDADAAQVRALGLATVMDLRTPDEIATRGRFPDTLGPVAYHHLPLFDVVPDWSQAPDVGEAGFLATRYVDMLESGRAAMSALLELLGEPSTYPAVFHCAAGKDRTGIVAGVVLGLLGVADETIVADYAMSAVAMARLDAWVAQTQPDLVEALAQRPSAVMSAAPATMASFLASVRTMFGSMEGLAADLGVGARTVARLRDILIV